MSGVRRIVGKMERSDDLSISYHDLLAIQRFVARVLARKGNIYDALQDELENSYKLFTRWTEEMEKSLGGNE
jgi:hypothetical protein